jgi:transposase InsO family protein
MSLNSEEKGSVGSAVSVSAALQGPRLQPGGYAAWCSDMDVFLQRNGAEGVHKEVMDVEEWKSTIKSVESWARDAYASAKALALGLKSESKLSTPVSDDVKAARKLVSAMVERSRRVYGIIYSALPEELRAQSAHIENGFAYGLWKWLQDKFQSTEEDSVGLLLGQWTTLQQEEGETFDAYRTKVNKVANLLERAKEKQSARMYAYVLLDKLLPRYKQAVLALKASGKLKELDKVNWDEITAFINTHEREEMRLRDSEADGGDRAMAARQVKNNAWNQGRPRELGTNQNSRDAGNHLRSNTTSGSRQAPKPLAEIRCFRCDQLGHFARRCTAATPYKENTQRNDTNSANNRSQGSAYASAGSNNGSRSNSRSSSAGPNRAVTFKQEKVGATLSVNRFDVFSSDDEESDCNELDDVDDVLRVDELIDNASVDKLNASVSKVKENKLNDVPKDSERVWGIDSMASLHVSGNRRLFSNLRKCTPVEVEVANGSTVYAAERGTVTLSTKIAGGTYIKVEIKKVYYHERFTANLLSWNILKAAGWQLHSTEEETYMMTPKGNRITLDTSGRLSVMKATPIIGAADRVYNVVGMMSPNVQQLVDLHKKLGHIGFDRMINIVKAGMTLNLGKLNVTEEQLKEARRLVLECTACTMAKGRRTAFGHRGLDIGNAPGETLHMDTYFVQRKARNRQWVEYGLVVKDPFTSHRWFAKLTSKDQVANAVIGIIKHAKTQCGCNVKRLYADGGSEFINQTLKTFCHNNGIELHPSPPRTQQLNGIAENNVGSMKDMVRTLMMGAGMKDHRFWDLAAKHSVYVWNRIVVSKHTKVTPFEAMYKRKPDAQHWGVFGCDAYYHVPKVQRDALDPKMEPCIYLGHDQIQNCAMIYVLSTGKMIHSRDVKFRPNSFTHIAALEKGKEAITEVLNTGYVEQTEVQVDDRENNNEIRSQGEHERLILSESKSDTEYDVESIIGKRTKNGRTQYHVKWAGYPEEETTWEDEQMVTGANELVREYEEANRQVEAVNIPDASQQGDASQISNSRTEPAISISEEPRRESRRLRGFDPDGNSIHHVNMVMRVLRNSHADADLDGVYENTHTVNAITTGVGLLEEQTPQTYQQAIEDKHSTEWKAAMDKELAGCLGQEVWDLVPRSELPKGANILPCKWVYKIKVDELGNVAQYKARLCPKGFRQKEGKDYFDVFAATGMYKTMRVALSLAAKWDHELDQLDIPQAFINADVEEDIYMELPEGPYRDANPGMVCKLRKSLYGLKQSPRNWYLLLTRFIAEELGYKACVSDPCLFYRRSRTGRLMLLYVFVDDMQSNYHREDAKEWNEIKAKLVARFNTKDMGPSKWMLGMRITRNRSARTITLDQELYVTKALEKYGLAECRVVSTPEIVNSSSLDVPLDGLDRSLEESVDKTRYMEITGTLMYAAIAARPDIAHAAHSLASHMQAPTKRDIQAAERVLRYLAGTRDVGLVFGSRNGGLVGDSRGRTSPVQVDVCAYADADWANNKQDRKSITGWVAKLNGDAVSWSSKKQRTVAMSTCEAELYAEAAAIQEVLWMRGLMKELGLNMQTGSIVHGDNQSTITISKNGVKSERTKHVDVKYHFVTETIDRGEVQLKWVPTAEQQADIFTKALPAPAFEVFRKQLMTR